MAEARRAHAEVFLLYLNQKKGRTVAEAKAMADIEVNVTAAETAWRVKLEEIAQDRADYYLELLRAAVELEDDKLYP